MPAEVFRVVERRTPCVWFGRRIVVKHRPLKRDHACSLVRAVVASPLPLIYDTVISGGPAVHNPSRMLENQDGGSSPPTTEFPVAETTAEQRIGGRELPLNGSSHVASRLAQFVLNAEFE